MELARNLKTDSVSRLQPTAPHAVSPSQPLSDAVALMRRHRVGCLLVCEGNRLIGIFTERDLLQRVLAVHRPLSEPVRNCMTPAPVTVHPKEPIGVAIRRMEEGGYRHLPVVDSQGKPTGILSVRRFVHYLAEHFPTTVYNLPPDPDAVPKAPEGA
jgi:CBS domain-containing protein